MGKDPYRVSKSRIIPREITQAAMGPAQETHTVHEGERTAGGRRRRPGPSDNKERRCRPTSSSR